MRIDNIKDRELRELDRESSLDITKDTIEILQSIINTDQTLNNYMDLIELLERRVDILKSNNNILLGRL
jgi:hypothetical protein